MAHSDAATSPDDPHPPSDDWDDATLVGRSTSGDDQAFAVLVRRYQGPLYRHAWRYADRSDFKTELEHGPEFDSQIPAAEVTIRLNDGRTLTRRVEKSSMTGDPRARMADAALKSKFIECAEDLMPESQIDRIIECCLRLDTLDDVGELIRLTKVSERLQ